MKFKTIIILSVLSLFATGSRAAEATVEVDIKANDQMKFDVTRIQARPGQKVHVTLTNVGTLPKAVMGHNWVLLKAGADPVAYANAAIAAAAENYEPKALAGQVLASIPLLGPKQSRETTFTAPDTPGTYHYLCSFPAHFMAGMKGELVVK